jgi:hypothetical protein
MQTPKYDFRTKNRMHSICCCVKGVIHLELLQENTTLNAISYHAQQEKLESEVVLQGLFGGKIYFQNDNAKTQISKITVNIYFVPLGHKAST